MTTSRSRFQRGSGVFCCRSCGHNTRATGRGDNEHLRLCAECFDLGGIENEISDVGSTPELEAAAAELRAKIANRASR